MINHSRSQLIILANQNNCIALKKAVWQYQFQNKPWEDALHDCIVELVQQNHQLNKTVEEISHLMQSVSCNSAKSQSNDSKIDITDTNKGHGTATDNKSV